MVEYASGPGPLELSIFEDGDLIGDRLDFGQSVADVEDGDSVLFPLMDFLKEDFRFRSAQGSRWFIEDEDFGLLPSVGGDFEHLLLADA